MMPETARDEVGRWKGSVVRRVTGQSNRYSRKGEKILQVLLRAYALERLRSKLQPGPVIRLPLDYFAAQMGDIGEAEAAWNAIDAQCRAAA